MSEIDFDGADHDVELGSDECELLDLDPTGRDGDPRFPYTYGKLTADERERLAS